MTKFTAGNIKLKIYLNLSRDNLLVFIVFAYMVWRIADLISVIWVCNSNRSPIEAVIILLENN